MIKYIKFSQKFNNFKNKRENWIFNLSLIVIQILNLLQIYQKEAILLIKILDQLLEIKH